MHSEWHLFRIALLILTLSSMIGGCSLWQRPLSPDIKLVGVELKKARPHKQDFLLKLHIHNPNETELPLYRIKYSLILNDELVLGQDKVYIKTRIPPHATVEVKLPLTTNLWGQLRSIAELVKESDGRLSYDLETRIKLRRFSLKKRRVTFMGTVDSSSLQKKIRF